MLRTLSLDHLFPLAHGWAQVKDLHFCSVFLLPCLIHNFHKRFGFFYSAQAHLNMNKFRCNWIRCQPKKNNVRVTSMCPSLVSFVCTQSPLYSSSERRLSMSKHCDNWHNWPHHPPSSMHTSPLLLNFMCIPLFVESSPTIK